MNVSRLSQAGRRKITSLRQKKHREATGHCLVEGRRAVESAVLAGASIHEMVATENLAADPEIERLLAAAGGAFVATTTDFRRMSDVATSQGILAVADMAWSRLEDLAELARVVVLDGIQDPGNVGTIIRSAAWFGVDAILCGPGVADCYGPKVLRATMGAVWDVRLVRSSSLVHDLRTLSSTGMSVYGADLDGQPVHEWAPAVPSCIVLGSEAHGISVEIANVLDDRVRIPRHGRSAGTESLNVAVAAGILMSHWARRRKSSS